MSKYEAEYDEIIGQTCQELGIRFPEKEYLLFGNHLPDRGIAPDTPRHWYGEKLGNRRRFACDYFFPDLNVIVEIEGIAFLGRMTRHTTPMGFEKDTIKYNAAAMIGYTLLRYSPRQLRAGLFQKDMEFLLNQYAKNPDTWRARMS